MAATIGTGTTAKFPAAAVYPMDVLSISMSGLSRETVPVSHLGSTPAMEFLETELYDPGEITLELHLDSTAPSIPGVIDNIHGTLLIEFAGGRIPLMHVRDGVVGNPERSGYETLLGDGDVDMIGVLAALQGAEFRGPYIVRRCQSDSPLKDLEVGRDRLTRLLPPA